MFNNQTNINSFSYAAPKATTGTLSNSFAYAAPGLIRDRELQQQLARNIRRPDSKVIVSAKESRQIQEAVESHFGLNEVQLRRKTRKREIVFARQLSMFLHWKKTNYTLSKIGKMYGGKDHTTVIHSRKKIEEYLSQKHDSAEKKELLAFFEKYGFEL